MMMGLYQPMDLVIFLPEIMMSFHLFLRLFFIRTVQSDGFADMYSIG